MPYILQSGSKKNPFMGAVGEYKYTYPLREGSRQELDLRPGSDLHQRIIDKCVSAYALNSASVIAERHPTWRAMDDTLQGYIDLSQEEQEAIAEDPRIPVSIVFPYSYAILETLISYMVTAFFPEPMFRYEGNGPEDTAGAFYFKLLSIFIVSATKLP